MCVGCRAAVDKADLLRVVATDGMLSPDPPARRPGRGAYLHPDLGCLDAAERRRAFSRALRVPGALDPTVLRGYLEQQSSARPNSARPNSSQEN
jgi:predicted RNA-binding protein YlxR (DUF448 family)